MKLKTIITGGLAAVLSMSLLASSTPNKNRVHRPSHQQTTNSIKERERYAVLIVTDDFHNSTYPSDSFDKGTRNSFLLALSEVYSSLIDLDFSAENISVLYTNGKVESAEVARTPSVQRLMRQEGVEGKLPSASLENITQELSQAHNALRKNDQLIVVLFGHNYKEGERTYFNIPTDGPNTRLYAKQVDQLGKETKGQQLYIIDACYSGMWGEKLGNGNRTILTSSSANSPGITSRTDNFASYVLEAATDSTNDTNKDGKICANEAFLAGKEQRAPILRQHYNNGDLAFFPLEGFKGRAYNIQQDFILK